MVPIKRKPVDKVKSTKNFNKTEHKTKLINVAPKPMRGGIRL